MPTVICIQTSRMLASEALKTSSAEYICDVRKTAGENATRKKNMIIKFRRMVYSQIARIRKGTLVLLFISTPIPYPCCNHTASKPGIPAEAYENGDEEIRELRDLRCGSGRWSSLLSLRISHSLSLLSLGCLFCLLWCLGRSSLWLSTV